MSTLEKDIATLISIAHNLISTVQDMNERMKKLETILSPVEPSVLPDKFPTVQERLQCYVELCKDKSVANFTDNGTLHRFLVPALGLDNLKQLHNLLFEQGYTPGRRTVAGKRTKGFYLRIHSIILSGQDGKNKNINSIPRLIT